MTFLRSWQWSVSVGVVAALVGIVLFKPSAFSWADEVTPFDHYTGHRVTLSVGRTVSKSALVTGCIVKHDDEWVWWFDGVGPDATSGAVRKRLILAIHHIFENDICPTRRR